jgi:hypothetical protein
MSTTVTEAMVQQYGTNFRTLYQQRQSRMAAFCQMEGGIVGQSKSVERIGKAEAYDITSRGADTKYVDVPHSRRWIDLQDKGWAELVDEMDKIRMLADPTSPYAAMAVAALNRAKDDIILAAARGNARTNNGLIPLPASQKIAVGGTSLTLAKLLATKEILDTNEVGRRRVAAGRRPEPEHAGHAHDRGQRQDADEPVRHHGNQERGLQQRQGAGAGRDRHVPGLQVRAHRAPGLRLRVNTRFGVAWVKSCVGLGIGKDIVSSIDTLPGKNYSAQVYARMSIGAARLEDEGVVEIGCFE